MISKDVRTQLFHFDLDDRLIPLTEQTKIKFRSKSFDHLPSDDDDHHVSNTTRTELDLTGIGYEMNSDIQEGETLRSQSAPVTPTKMFDKEFLSFLQCEQEMISDSFVYNIDLSNGNENIHSRREILLVSSRLSFPDSLVKTREKKSFK